MTHRPDLPRPNHRLGPRPLLLHLMLAMRSSPSSSGAWTSSSAGWPGWTGQPQADAPGLLPDAALIAGIAAYRRHPWQRDLADPPVVWAEGGSRLLDYGSAGAPPVLFVPSLVNRAHVLDLMEGHSMLRYLAQGGVRPLLLDWGWPGTVECRFTLTDYIAGRLERAILSVGEPLTLAGYCMGGLMAVAAALRRPDRITRLVLLATPWDFWCAGRDAACRLAASLPWLELAFAAGGAMPVDALQMLFSLVEPGSVGAKYRDFGTQDQRSDRARRFVALEDWLNDGIPLPAPVARAVLGGWYGENAPAAGTWRVAGATVQPQLLRMESFVAVPAQDRIVPPGSALALAELLPGAVLHRPESGHVGMVAGAQARRALWAPLLEWLGQRGAQPIEIGVGAGHVRPVINQSGASVADLEALARQHGVSQEAVRVLQQAVQRGGGHQAQFSHPELGGMGQWSSGGMTQVGDMFDTALRDKVAALCAALAQQPQAAPPHPQPAAQPDDWWPEGLGAPSAAGAQNSMRYACFPDARRVAVEQAGVVTLYDTGEHRIGGVSQSQGGGQSLLFTSQLGTVRAQDLPVAR